ncbi:hypothetical protein BKA66DRAFT_442581 [Pyrenochaeta sp. MPI-SDFR-AT-0127]|nr:hypothetical protein BKA66DRAFT_442581 [Pyrenochaeta sp. MPI-SDFR-AT-0127]
MLSTSLRPSSWLYFLLVLLSIVQVSICFAQDNNWSGNEDSRTSVAARNPESSSTSSQPSSTSSAPTQTHTVQVGLADHKMRPEVTKAKVGDIVEFRFYPTNHSIVRAEYGYPCIPYEMTGSNKQGFFSGFHAVDKVLDDPPNYRIRINDTNPIFFYCSAPGSCITYAMIGAINPNTSTPILKQQALARDSAYMLNPGEPFPAEAPPLPSSNPGAPAGNLVPTAEPPGEKKGLGAGAIAGIVIAGISVIVLAALLFFFWGRTASLKDEVDRRDGTLRRVSPSSSTAMLEAGRHATGRGDAGLGLYPHSTPSPNRASAPGYYAPAQQQQKYMATSPVGHPAYSPLAFSPSPTDTSTPHIQSPMTTSAASPTAIYTHTPHSGYETYTPSQQQQPPPPPPPPHRAPSPQCLDSQDAKLGPYGRQVYCGTGSNDAAPAPAYFEVVRGLEEGEKRLVHVNRQQGPVEMEGTPASATLPVVRPTWQEVKAEARMF